MKYRVHAFTSSDTFTINSLAGPSARNTIEYVIVGGGGAGRPDNGGGGGAGGVIYGNVLLTSANIGSFLCVVGAGGINSDGNYSNVIGLVGTQVLGGGLGGKYNNLAGAPGGSGGGGGGPAAAGGSGTPGQGFPGGTASGTAGGGGGGAGQAGLPTGEGAHGGNGIAISWVTPNYGMPGPTPGRWFGGGGGGMLYAIPAASSSKGGIGGGGKGGIRANPPTLQPAELNGLSGNINTGGGGGGAWAGPQPAGGSGIILIRYPVQTNPPLIPRISRISNVTSNVATVTANALVSFTINTILGQEGEGVYYSSVGNVTSFLGANTGLTVLSGNTATVSLRPANVFSLSDVALQVRRKSATGPIIGVSNTVNVEPAVEVLSSAAIITHSSTDYIYETENVTISISTTYGDPGTRTFYYETLGSADIIGNTSGTITSDQDVTLTMEATVDPGKTKTFAVRIKEYEDAPGPALISNAITVRSIEDFTLTEDSDIISASGGTTASLGTSYKAHYFTTGSTFTVSSLSTQAPRNLLEYFVIAGGGGGHAQNAGYYGGGAGGAGGVLYGNVTLAPPGITNYTVTIGGGGAGQTRPAGASNPTYNRPGTNPGGASSLSGGAISATATGGGGAGLPGGSGGGPAPFGNGGGTAGQGSAGGGYGGGGWTGPGANPLDGWPGTPTYHGRAIMAPPSFGTLGDPTPEGDRWFGGGGGAGGVEGGYGGGGAGGRTAVAWGDGHGHAGNVNTGGGGGAGGWSGVPRGGQNGGPGGSGIVIVRYPLAYEYLTRPKASRVTSIAANTSSIGYGDIFTVSVATDMAQNNETLYYRTFGTATNATLSGGNTGSFAVVSNTANLTFTTSGTANASFRIGIARGSSAGKIIANTDVINYTYIPVSGISATGGLEAIYEENGQYYKSHTFVSSNTFTINSLSPAAPYNSVEYLVLGGGAGGGLDQGGGGGAGGMLVSSFTGSAASYTVTVGGGGTASNSSPRDGANSSISSPGLPAAIVALGGGAGGSEGAPGNGGNGTYGSGGGAAGWSAKPGTSGTPGQGYGGGSSTPNTGGGGGGAGGAGENAPPAKGGVGGSAGYNTYRTGANVAYAGGGGGGGYNGTTPAYSDGGGAGAGRGSTGGDIPADETFGLRNAQIPNRGSGGGGGWGFGDPEARGGSGSSGIVVLRYKISADQAVNVSNVQILAAGGGGGGGSGHPAAYEAGGGGAGGLVYISNLDVTPGTTYSVIVGAGGSANGSGSNTTISTPGGTILVALGGGAGGTAFDGAGATGGSGGGGSHEAGAGGSGTQTTNQAIPAISRTYGFGNAGGTGDIGQGGGGGGAGEAGNTDGQGTGGDGREYSIEGSATFYAGGGAFGSAAGGQGGGGTESAPGASGSGTINTGGGGAGGNNNGEAGGTGGSGVLIISYPSAYVTATYSGNVNYSGTTDGRHVYKFTDSGTITF